MTLSALSCTGSKEIGKILKAHFKAAGGLEQLNKINTVHRSGEMKMICGRTVGMTAKFEETVIIGEKHIHKRNYYPYDSVSTVTIVYNRTERWSTGSHSGSHAVFISPLQSFYDKYGNGAFRLSKDEIFSGKVCTVLRVAGSQVRFYIDKTSYLVRGLKMPYNTDVRRDRTMTIEYAVYTEYGGVMFPDTVTVSVDDPRGEARRDVGGFGYKYTYKKTEIDVTLDKTLFGKPK